MLRILQILILFFLLIALDGIWFSLALNPLYQPIFARINQQGQNEKIFVRYVPALITWLLIAVALYYFVLSPNKSSKYLEVCKKASLLGLVIYGVYNGTNFATLKKYPIGLALVDTVWGMSAMSLVSILFLFLQHHFEKL
jgi:uncharacterized membrane protein